MKSGKLFFSFVALNLWQETSSFVSHGKVDILRKVNRESLQDSSLYSSFHQDENQAAEPHNDKLTGGPSVFDDRENVGGGGDVSSLGKKLVDGLPFVEIFRQRRKIPPIQVDDTNLLLYDVFLIVNLTLSISFWVTHRMQLSFLSVALGEGSLLSIFWVISGLYHGMFLHSAVDGHYSSGDERAGPVAAATLALNTYVNAVNLRLIFALVCAVVEHRQAGIGLGEELLPLEIGFGLLLMTSWRALHSSITPRL